VSRADRRAGGAHDYVLVGGGTAGCVLAHRLSEDPAVRVLLVEDGPWDRHPLIHVPAGFAKLPPRYSDWGYVTTPQAGADDREVALPQGHVIGGGGSVNAQVYLRGAQSDYDNWAQTYGCEGWDFASMNPYLVRAETNQRLGEPFHGRSGPITVSDPVEPHRLSQAFVAAGQEWGLPRNLDFNGAEQFGVGLYQTSTTPRRVRCSAARGYLKPARGRPNLAVLTGARATRIVVRDGRARGVEVVANGTRTVHEASSEVLVTAGALGSPRLLLLTGVGPADHLGEVGVPVVADVAGVGQNLHDHWSHELILEIGEKLSMDQYGAPGPRSAAAVLRYVTRRRGPLASTVAEAGAFVPSQVDGSDVDLQLTFLPAAREKPGYPALPVGFGVSLSSWPVRPRSRGELRLRSTDPDVPPTVDPRYLSEAYDREVSVAALRISREIAAQPSLARLVKSEHYPGAAHDTDADILAFVRSRGRTGYHHVGTCAMGTGESAVVDPQLRVRGVEALRVCDSSVMPQIVSSNTQAATVAVAEKAARIILDNI
jgi:choline dehydrogenase